MTFTNLGDSAHRQEDYEIDLELLPHLWRMEEKHFWHAARNQWILHALRAYGCRPPAAFLEVGCGSGAVALALSEVGYEVTGVDTAEPMLRKASSRMPAVRFLLGDVAALPKPYQGPYDVIGLFDVLEHLDSPEVLLTNTLKWSKPGSVVIVTVPAVQSLYSMVDRISGHKCRYEVDQLRSLMQSCGLGQVEVHGIFRSILPLLKLRRSGPVEESSSLERRRDLMRKDFRIPNPVVNSMLYGLSCAERVLGYALAKGRPGASLIAVGRVASLE